MSQDLQQGLLATGGQDMPCDAGQPQRSGLMESWHKSCCHLKHKSWKLGSCCEIMDVSPLGHFLFLTQGKENGLSKQVLCALLHPLLSYAPIRNPIMGLSSDQRSVLVLPRGCMCCFLAEYQQVILTSTEHGHPHQHKLGCPHQYKARVSSPTFAWDMDRKG